MGKLYQKVITANRGIVYYNLGNKSAAFKNDPHLVLSSALVTLRLLKAKEKSTRISG